MTNIRLFFVALIMFLFCGVLSAKEDISIEVPSFDKDGKITTVEYVREYPTTVEDCTATIDALVAIYNEVSSAYQKQIEEDQTDINILSSQISSMKENLDSTVDNANLVIDDNTAKKNLWKFSDVKCGICGMAQAFPSSYVFGLNFMLKMDRLFILGGPNFYAPRTITSGNANEIGAGLAAGLWLN